MKSPPLTATCLYCQPELKRTCPLPTRATEQFGSSPHRLFSAVSPKFPGVPAPAAISTFPDVPCPELPETLLDSPLNWAPGNRREAAAHGAAHDRGWLSEFCMAVQSLAFKVLCRDILQSHLGHPPSTDGEDRWGGGRRRAQGRPAHSRRWNSECQLLTNPLHPTT